MAKLKKKLSEHVNNKKRSSDKTTQNPFEVHINKQKYEILGRKLKNDRGLPGVSRARAIKKRKGTLLQEYNLQHKSNKFVDRRIGERNVNLTEEERKIARYTAERIKHHNRKSIFNLADNEILTHRGQTLTEIEKFDDPRSDDEEDEEYGNKSGKLDDHFVEDAHFGGGILQKTGKEGAKTHKDLIEQLIAESKKRKAEKQKTREETIELTEKLDTEWKDLIPLVSKSKKDDEKVETQQKADDYDKIMRELKFEARGKPSDRLKSEEEIAREEKERLEILEQERLERMQGFKDSGPSKQHRSADDLDDNFDYESDTEMQTLTYNELGECNVDLLASMENSKENLSVDEESEENSSDEEAETEDDLSDLKESDTDSDLEETNLPVKEEKSSKNTKNTPEKRENCVPSNENVDEQISNIKNTTNSPEKLKNCDESSTKVNKRRKSDVISNNIEKTNDISNTNLEVNKEKAPTSPTKNNKLENPPIDVGSDLPFTFNLPDSYENLATLLENESPERQNIIIERMIKCNHPSLASTNKENLSKLFIYLLQHINDLVQDCDSSENVKTCFSVMDKMTPHLYSLAKLNPENAQDSLMEVLKEKQNEYREKSKEYPGLDVLLYLKLIGCLFSTSDFRHQLVTPTFVFIGQMLTNCRVKRRYDVAYGLFLVTLFVEYTNLSKRFMPAAIIYLCGMLHMAIPKLGVKLVKIIPPFKPSGTQLVLSKKTIQSELVMKSEDFINEELDEDFRQRALHITLNVIHDLYQHWKNLPSSNEIFEHVLKLLRQIPQGKYCKEVRENMKRIQDVLEDGRSNKKIDYIMPEKKRPKALRLYEPDIQKVYDGKQHRPMSKEKAEREKLLHKYKREMKGALREIRRDKSFLGRLKIKQQIQSDQERREKVKRIFAEASLQQGELNALDRKKKRK